VIQLIVVDIFYRCRRWRRTPYCRQK